MAAHDYIPRKDREFDTFFNTLRQYVNTKCNPPDAPQWGFIPSDRLVELNEAYTDWHATYLPTISPHTPVQTEAKNDAKTAAINVIRPFVNQYLRFPPVTNEDRTTMAIPNKDTTPTPIPPPVDQAEADIGYPGIHLIELKIRAIPASTSGANNGAISSPAANSRCLPYRNLTDV